MQQSLEDGFIQLKYANVLGKFLAKEQLPLILEVPRILCLGVKIKVTLFTEIVQTVKART